jgi:translation initiation factor IF-2
MKVLGDAESDVRRSLSLRRTADGLYEYGLILAEKGDLKSAVNFYLAALETATDDEMKKAMAGLLEPTFKEVRLGIAEVRNTFKVPKFGTIAGCMVTEGRITRAGEAHARLLRDNVVIYEGKIKSLRRFKDDVSEVKAGFECGIGFERFNDIKVGDVIEVFVNERVAVTA